MGRDNFSGFNYSLTLPIALQPALRISNGFPGSAITNTQCYIVCKTSAKRITRKEKNGQYCGDSLIRQYAIYADKRQNNCLLEKN